MELRKRGNKAKCEVTRCIESGRYATGAVSCRGAILASVLPIAGFNEKTQAQLRYLE